MPTGEWSAKREPSALRPDRAGFALAIFLAPAAILLAAGRALLYPRHLPPGKSILYYPEGTWPGGGTEWLILHSFETSESPATAIATTEGTRYILAKVFPHYGLSGWDWLVYRKAR